MITMGRHSTPELGATTGKHAVPVITDLRERLADPGLQLCPHGRACPLYAGTAPRHTARLHSRNVSAATDARMGRTDYDPDGWIFE